MNAGTHLVELLIPGTLRCRLLLNHLITCCSDLELDEPTEHLSSDLLARLDRRLRLGACLHHKQTCGVLGLCFGFGDLLGLQVDTMASVLLQRLSAVRDHTHARSALFVKTLN